LALLVSSIVAAAADDQAAWQRRGTIKEHPGFDSGSRNPQCSTFSLPSGNGGRHRPLSGTLFQAAYSRPAVVSASGTGDRMTYYFSKKLGMPFDEAIQHVRNPWPPRASAF
jgi:hypothetical protein